MVCALWLSFEALQQEKEPGWDGDNTADYGKMQQSSDRWMPEGRKAEEREAQ